MLPLIVNLVLRIHVLIIFILNEGLTEKIIYVLDDSDTMLTGVATSTLSNLIDKVELGKSDVSHLSKRVDGGTAQSPVFQYSV